MSKKKATMTLKDFHGGSIPSDLPLPSAPGVTMKPSDRPSFERQASWGIPAGRSDQRLRPGSAGSLRNFDDRTPFLTNSACIGRNFDEDERKPLEGIPASRRTISDETVTTLPARVEPTRPHTTPTPQVTSGSTSSYAARFTESIPHVGPNSQNVGGPHPNAWGLKKEVVADSGPTSWTAPEAAMKLATASAMEKVTSGRWHSKQLIHPTNVEVITHPEAKSDTYSKSVEFYDATVTVPRYAENSLAANDGTRIVGKESQSPVSFDSSERPKLKLLPRSNSKPSVEPFVDHNKNSTVFKENGIETRGKANPVKHVVVAANSGNQAVVERPKLNLKPRSQPPEQLDGNIETERNALFGGARPREFVLKERGIDDVAADIQNHGQPPNRTETLPVNATPKAYTEKAGSSPLDHRITKNIVDRRDHRANLEKKEVNRNWRSENRGKSSREVEKVQERPPSPETWRKPIEQPASLDAPTNPRYGKAASAVELAQAFSKSVSDPKTGDRFPGRRGTASQGNIPFSRLTSPLPRPQINGY